VTCARYMQRFRQVRVAVVDLGAGIHSTLLKQYPSLSSPREAIEKVLYGGYSARSRVNNAGQGINNLRICVGGRGGNLTLISQSGLVHVVPQRTPHATTAPFHFPGTAIFFTLPVVKSIE
jgi:hypothetical protein